MDRQRHRWGEDGEIATERKKERNRDRQKGRDKWRYLLSIFHCSYLVSFTSCISLFQSPHSKLYFFLSFSLSSFSLAFNVNFVVFVYLYFSQLHSFIDSPFFLLLSFYILVYLFSSFFLSYRNFSHFFYLFNLSFFKIYLSFLSVLFILFSSQYFCTHIRLFFFVFFIYFYSTFLVCFPV